MIILYSTVTSRDLAGSTLYSPKQMKCDWRIQKLIDPEVQAVAVDVESSGTSYRCTLSGVSRWPIKLIYNAEWTGTDQEEQIYIFYYKNQNENNKNNKLLIDKNC